MPERLTSPTSTRFGESKLRGSIIHERAIRKNVEYLSGLKELAARAGSYRALLSGESLISEPPEGQRSIRSKKILSELGLLDKSYWRSFGGVLVGADYRRLESTQPEGQYKFYSSFDLTSEHNVKLGEQWFGEVAQRASEAGISLKTKAFDHSYDSLNLYTWEPDVMTKILQEVYPKYVAEGLYYATPHFFQGEIDGIDPDHVGFVQEPFMGWPPENRTSHSGRMRRLGESIDSFLSVSPELTTRQFVEASLTASVNPEHPYLIAA